LGRWPLNLPFLWDCLNKAPHNMARFDPLFTTDHIKDLNQNYNIF